MSHQPVRTFSSSGQWASQAPTDPNAPLQGLGDLYQEVIVDHAKRPRFKYRPSPCAFCEAGKNPLCGDSLTVFAHCVEDEKNKGTEPSLQVYFEGSGCSISQASASMMCEAVRGQSVTGMRETIRRVEDLFTGRVLPSDPLECIHDFEALSGVSKFPVRVKCAALAWKTLELLLNENFDAQGNRKSKDSDCVQEKNCSRLRRSQLKIVEV